MYFLFIVINSVFSDDRSISESLWIRFLKGEEDALSKLFLMYYDDLFLYGMKICKDEDLVKDSIQDLFLKLWRKKNSLEHVSFVKIYLVKSIRRILIRGTESKLKRTKRELEYSLGFDNYEQPDSVNMIKQEILEERKAILKSAIQKLTKRQKEVIFLRFYEGMSNEEIAQIMEITNQRVRNLLYESIQRIKEKTHLNLI